MNSDEFILSILVNNEDGVLTLVSSLFSRRAFNIDSLSVGVTDDPKISRITIVARGDDYVKNQIILQLEKLHDVKKVELMPQTGTVMRRAGADQIEHLRSPGLGEAGQSGIPSQGG